MSEKCPRCGRMMESNFHHCETAIKDETITALRAEVAALKAMLSGRTMYCSGCEDMAKMRDEYETPLTDAEAEELAFRWDYTPNIQEIDAAIRQVRRERGTK